MIRKATIRDVTEIKRIINMHAKKGRMLPRPVYAIYEAIRDFYVAEVEGKIVGCCAINIYGKEYGSNGSGENMLGEIRSLAVLPKMQGKDIGTALVTSAIADVKAIGVTRVFTLTYVPEFFRKLGFSEMNHRELPQKIWSDCKGCIKFPDECDEIAMGRDV